MISTEDTFLEGFGMDVNERATSAGDSPTTEKPTEKSDMERVLLSFPSNKVSVSPDHSQTKRNIHPSITFSVRINKSRLLSRHAMPSRNSSCGCSPSAFNHSSHYILNLSELGLSESSTETLFRLLSQSLQPVAAVSLSLTTVTTLNLSRNLLSMPSLETLSHLSSTCPLLHTLDLSHNSLKGTLKLPRGWITLKGVSRVGKLSSHSSARNQKLDESLKELPPNLRSLNLSHNQLTDVGDLIAIPSLTTLNISNNSLARFDILPSKLKTLDISSNLLRRMLDLRPLGICTNLTALSVHHNPLTACDCSFDKSHRNSKALIRSLFPRLVELDGMPISYTTLPPQRAPFCTKTCVNQRTSVQKSNMQSRGQRTDSADNSKSNEDILLHELYSGTAHVAGSMPHRNYGNISDSQKLNVYERSQRYPLRSQKPETTTAQASSFSKKQRSTGTNMESFTSVGSRCISPDRPLPQQMTIPNPPQLEEADSLAALGIPRLELSSLPHEIMSKDRLIDVVEAMKVVQQIACYRDNSSLKPSIHRLLSDFKKIERKLFSYNINNFSAESTCMKGGDTEVLRAAADVIRRLSTFLSPHCQMGSSMTLNSLHLDAFQSLLKVTMKTSAGKSLQQRVLSPAGVVISVSDVPESTSLIPVATELVDRPAKKTQRNGMGRSSHLPCLDLNHTEGFMQRIRNRFMHRIMNLNSPPSSRQGENPMRDYKELSNELQGFQKRLQGVVEYYVNLVHECSSELMIQDNSTSHSFHDSHIRPSLTVFTGNFEPLKCHHNTDSSSHNVVSPTASVASNRSLSSVLKRDRSVTPPLSSPKRLRSTQYRSRDSFTFEI